VVEFAGSLPVGPLVLSVRESPTDAAAHTSYLADRVRLGSTVDTAGLGKYAYHSERHRGPGEGQVHPDRGRDRAARAVRRPGQKRADLGYEVASVVLGCWTGDG
jgi:hypothetical protein